MVEEYPCGGSWNLKNLIDVFNAIHHTLDDFFRIQNFVSEVLLKVDEIGDRTLKCPSQRNMNMDMSKEILRCF